MMRVIESLSSIRKSGKPIVLAAGFFDGVHRGHQKVLQVAQENARRIGGQAWVMTFAVHPMKILSPRKRPPLITCTEHKLKIFDEMNMDACLLYPFKKSTAKMSAIDFLGSLTENIKASIRMSLPIFMRLTAKVFKAPWVSTMAS